MSVKVKICGLTTSEDAAAAVAAAADLVGVNFVPSSKRCVPLGGAAAVCSVIPRSKRVGVFADAARAEVEEHAAALDLGWLQFHGDESPEFCAGWPMPVIKAVRAPTAAELVRLAERYAAVDYLLVDAWVPGALGGTGTLVDLDVAGSVPSERLFVAGGLRPDNVADVVRRLRPYAVDVASGVESSTGRKDHAEIERFITNATGA